MATDLKLFVYIIGLCTCSESFLVKITSSQTVAELKDAIYEQASNGLRGIDADHLILYKVELPDGDTLQQSAPQALDEELKAGSKELSKLFPMAPPKMTVSIVVEIPRPSE
jgi:hypothetical protein